MTNPISGAKYFLRGLSMLNKPGIRQFVIIPLVLNLIIFSFLMYFATGYFIELLDWLVSKIPDIFSILKWILVPIFILFCLVIFAFGFSIVANIIAAPFNSYLALAVEKHLTGKQVADSGLSFPAELVLSLKNEMAKLLHYIAWAIPIILLSFIPIFIPILPFLWILFGAWMMSLQYLDYPMANHSLAFKIIRRHISEKRFLTLGFGTAIIGATLIPIVNFLVMPIAVAGATILWVEQYLPPRAIDTQKEKLPESNLKINQS